ncbi:hypothetical protein ECSTECDG1313_1731 [Escherichia coli STEC_DG131-3]|nr:hypothetical protein ECSTECDG1313_1731 [Escherichia coli STEC_DG131-3]
MPRSCHTPAVPNGDPVLPVAEQTSSNLNKQPLIIREKVSYGRPPGWST